MNIISYIENLKEQPEHARRKVAFWWAFGITGAIFLFWLASFDFAGKSVRTSAAAVAEQVGAPGASIVAGTGALVGDIWSSIVGPKKVMYSEVQVLPGKN